MIDVTANPLNTALYQIGFSLNLKDNNILDIY